MVICSFDVVDVIIYCLFFVEMCNKYLFFGVGVFYGELSKMERFNILNFFCNGKLWVLVISEVGVRGLDIFICDFVVNLELLIDGFYYVYRGGWIGWLGCKGIVILVCEVREEFVLSKFEC